MDEKFFAEPKENLTTRSRVGVGLVILCAIGFFAALRLFQAFSETDSNDLFLDVIRGGVLGGLLGGLFALVALAFSLSVGGVKGVRLKEDGLLLLKRWSTRALSYSDIDPAVSTTATADQAVPRLGLVLKNGKRGKPLFIPRTLGRFTELAAALDERTGASLLAALNAPESGKRRAYRWLGAVGQFVSAVVIALAVTYTGVHWQVSQMLKSEGKTAHGLVVGHTVHDNGTRLLRYAFVTDNGVPVQRDLILPDEKWRGYLDGSRVSIRYLSQFPDYNRLVGEDEDTTLIWLMAFGVVGVCAAVIGGVLCLAGVKEEIANGRVRFVIR